MSARDQNDKALRTEGKAMNTDELEEGPAVRMRHENRDAFAGWTSFLISVRGRTEGTAQRYRRLLERVCTRRISTSGLK